MSGFRVIVTDDGSHSIRSDHFGATYHSLHGSLQESLHIFINAGLQFILEKNPPVRSKRTAASPYLNVFEMGFGTGLNAWLTLLKADELKTGVRYCGIEAHPLPLQQAHTLNYPKMLDEDKGSFIRLHELEWEKEHRLTDFFTFTKIQTDFFSFYPPRQFDLIYYDAFGPGTQPELWDRKALAKVSELTATGGVIVTYCAKGDVRRTLQSLGFEMERLPGPPGKREMLRGIKK